MARDPNEARELGSLTDRELTVQQVVSKRLSNLAYVLKSATQAHYGGFSLTCKPDGRWFGVARAATTEGTSVVAFGSGSSPWEALFELNATIARGGWKADQFAAERGLGAPEGVVLWEKERKGA